MSHYQKQISHSTPVALKKNKKLAVSRYIYSPSQGALSLLAENAELSEEDGRGVAFRRAAAVLKALPEPVTCMTQLRGLPCLGEHSLRVIKVSETFFWLLYQIERQSNILTLHSLHL